MSMSMPGPLPLIRDAVPADRPATVEFNGTVPKPGKFGFSSLTLGSVLPGSS